MKGKKNNIMKKELIPYYISRLIIAALFGTLFALSSPNIWYGVIIGLIIYAGMIWYAHNARYIIDTSTPFFPLRRDERGKSIRDKALVYAVTIGALSYLLLILIKTLWMPPVNLGSLAIIIAVIAYIGISNWMYTHSQQK